MNRKKRKLSPQGKSRTSSKKQQNYEIIAGNVIVTCPRGHKNQGQKVSDRKIHLRLVCANTTCNAEWTQTLPQITGLEEV